MILSLAACGKTKTKTTVKNDETIVTDDLPTTETQNTAEEQTNILPDLKTENVFEDVSSFDEFVEKIDDMGYKTVLTENGDGTVTVELKSPTTEDTSKPSIPTIETVTKPQKPEPAPSPETETVTPKEEETQKDNTDKDTQTPTPSPEIEPEIKPDPEPEKTPTVTEKEEEKKPTYTYTTNQKHTKLPYTKRYLYSFLNEEQKGWYQTIDKVVTNLEPSVIIDGIGNDRNYAIYYLYMFDNPEHFYLGYGITINISTHELTLCYSDGEMHSGWSYEIKEINDELRQRIIAKKAKFEKEVQKIISTIPANAPDVWKERLIYDRILMDSYYNLSAKWNGVNEDNWSAYGILVNKYGVCESYAEAFQTLCFYVGINCTGVVGNAGGGHKWNSVQLDGEWYMCDVTWDDPIGSSAGTAYFHTYFNITSERITELQHTWENSEYPVPECTATKYYYYNYFCN